MVEVVNPVVQIVIQPQTVALVMPAAQPAVQVFQQSQIVSVAPAYGERGVPGPPGRDGTDGMDGAPGRDGVDGRPGRDGVDGRPGRDGVDGRNGTDGVNGRDGKDGVNGTNGINGRDGVDGAPGRDGRDGRVGSPTRVTGTHEIEPGMQEFFLRPIRYDAGASLRLGAESALIGVR